MDPLLLPAMVNDEHRSAPPREAASRGNVWFLLLAMFLVTLAKSAAVAF